MATILDLYKDATKNKVSNDLYGKDAPRIESKGIINIPRQAALAASSPNAVADLIGNQVAGALGGNANRPTDTIFKNRQPFSRPVSLSPAGVTIEQGKLKNVIEAETDYFVKQSPAPQSLISRYQQGATSPLGIATNIATNALRNPLASAAAVKNLSKKLKDSDNTKTYGPAKSLDENGNYKNTIINFSAYYPEYRLEDGSYKFNTAITRNTNDIWDVKNNLVLSGSINESDYDSNKITRVIIKPEGADYTISLPGTISGLTENFSPEWNPFKYIGSPFSNYRYAGVERSINFSLKLYYTDEKTKLYMKNSLENLRKLVFPYETLSVITYNENNNKSVAFSPNLVRFSITGLYTNLFAFVEELSFTIDDNISWSTTDNDMSGNKTDPYPSVIDVSIGFKIIPEFSIIDGGTDTKVIRYNFNNEKLNIAQLSNTQRSRDIQRPTTIQSTIRR